MRSKIHNVVKESPGIYLRKLERKTGCSTSTLYHHIKKDQRLKSSTIHGYRCIYTFEIQKEFYRPLAALNHDKRGYILSAIYVSPERTTSNISEATGYPISTVSRHLNLLLEDDVVEVSIEGRKRQYMVSGTTLEAIRSFGTSLISRLTDRFIDSWSNF